MESFWSAGVGWNIHRESFYHSSLVSYLKLRATYGISGTVDQSKSGVVVQSYGGNFDATGFPYAQIIQFANLDLRWEKLRTANVGIDFSTKANRLSGSIEFYHKKRNGPVRSLTY